MKLLLVNKKLPSKCGEARIEFDQFAKRPTKKGATITIPLNHYVDFIPLSSGKQFFIENLIPGSHYEYYFGGTDNDSEKTVFLAQIQKSSLEIFKQHGEDAFYDSLVPEVIRFFSRRMRDSGGIGIIKRQGCIFFTQFPCAWEIVKDCRDFLFGDDVEFKKAEKEIILSTKHLFTGYYISINRSKINEVYRARKRLADKYREEPYIIGQGMILSEINKDISFDLTQSLYVISRAAGLVYPYNPDND